LSVIRYAVERFTAEHGGALPGQAGTEAGLKTDLLPYLRVFQKSPLTNTSTVVVDTTASPLTPGGATAWRYSKVDGTFICNSGATTKSDPSVTYDTL